MAKTMSAARPRKPPDMTRYSGRVADLMLKRRKVLGMTTEAFVAALIRAGFDANINTVYAWDQGRNQIPLDSLPFIARALRCDISEILPRK